MKKLLLILCILSSFNSKGAIHQIQVWNGYSQFLPPNNITVQLRDTIQWIPLDPPTMTHTITSDNIPSGAVPFNQVWQMPADTFFQYIPQVAGLYQYVCTPHIPNGMIGEFTVTNGANVQTYIPDDNFENYLEANGMGDGIQLNDSINTLSIEMLMYLDVSNQNISDLTGIEDFTVLSTLHCYSNQLTSLNISNNTALTFLNCVGNQLLSLDVSQNTALTYLQCSYNQLTSLDVSGATALTYLGCENNSLPILNISSATALIELHCYNNQLTSLDVNNNTELTQLQCFGNQLTSLDVSNNIALTILRCNDNQLTSLDVRNSNNDSVIDFNTINNPNLYCIDVDDSVWSTANWTFANGNIDLQHYFSNNCSGATSIQEHLTNKELIKITDVLGRETKGTKNEPLFYIYDNGTIEKKIIIE